MGRQTSALAGSFGALVAITLMAATSGWAREDTSAAGSGQKSGEVPVESYSPHFQRGKNLAEQWEYRIHFSNGYLLNYSFSISNVGPGDGTGLSLATLLLPDGSRRIIKNSRKKGEWRYEATGKGPHFFIVKNELEIRLPEHRIHIENEQGTIDLRIASTIDPMQPGRVQLEGSEWFQLTLIAPRLEAHGTVKLPGQEEVVLADGRGIAIHTVASLPENRFALCTFRFDSFDHEPQLSLYEITTPKSHGHRRIGSLVTITEGRIAYQTTEFDRTFSGLRQDPQYKPYLIPNRFELKRESEGMQLDLRSSLDVHPAGRLEVLDLLNSKALRMVLKRVSRPITYQFHGAYELEVEGSHGKETLQGTGFGSLDLTHKLPTDS